MTVSDTTKAKLASVVKAVATDIDDGAEPNSAIAKHAAAEDLPPSWLPPLINAVNVSCLLAHHKSASTVEERAATIPLAALPQVQDLLYAAKQAGDKPAPACNTSMSLPVPPTFSRREALVSVVDSDQLAKSAGCHGPSAGSMQRDSHKKRQRTWGRKQSSEAILRDKQFAANSDYAEKLASYDRLLNDLRVCVRNNAPWGESSRAHMVACCGEPAGLVWDAIGGETVKSACSSDAAMLQLQQKMAALCEVLPMLAAAKTAADKAHEAYATELAKSANLGTTLGVAAGTLLSHDMAAPMVSEIVPENDKLLDSVFDKLTHPTHEAELRNLRSAGSLYELLSVDPIIKEHPGEQVLDAYNRIVEMAPHIADQKIPLQTALRSYLQQGSLDNFQIDQVLKTNQLLGKKDQDSYGDVAKPTAATE